MKRERQTDDVNSHSHSHSFELALFCFPFGSRCFAAINFSLQRALSVRHPFSRQFFFSGSARPTFLWCVAAAALSALLSAAGKENTTYTYTSTSQYSKNKFNFIAFPPVALSCVCVLYMYIYKYIYALEKQHQKFDMCKV